MQASMEGRKALVTGGSVGLGKAMATRFAGAGAEVGLIARGQDRLDAAKAEIAEATGATVHAYSCDVCDAEQIEATFAQAESDMGQVDVLVNNAGASRTGTFVEITDEVWEADLKLKLFAAIRFARLAFPGMKERRWGRIINVLNIGAKAPGAGSAPTSVSRAAGMALTKVLAGEGAPHNVLVNALMTGFIDSDQWVRRHANLGGDMSYRDFLGKMATERGVPLGRVGESEEFANMACFLASDLGSYITGTAINIDGGRSPVV